ncbi:hypothetical protein LTR36_001461, partial [Oleoguttula mirabilis]
MEIVRQLGVRYLWVDRLCILQNHERTRSQVEIMNHIYSGAYVTLIAAASGGMRTRPGEKIMSHVGHSGGGYPKQMQLYGRLLDTQWATRGWTFQEQILCKRAIVFIDEYACQAGTTDENSISNEAMFKPQQPARREVMTTTTQIWDR